MRHHNQHPAVQLTQRFPKSFTWVAITQHDVTQSHKSQRTHKQPAISQVNPIKALGKNTNKALYDKILQTPFVIQQLRNLDEKHAVTPTDGQGGHCD